MSEKSLLHDFRGYGQVASPSLTPDFSCDYALFRHISVAR